MRLPARSFVFAPRFNSPPDRANPEGHDATGAFHVGMQLYKRFMEAQGGVVVEHLFDNTERNAARLRRGIYDAMRRNAGPNRYDAVIYFGHGFDVGLSSAKINDREPLREFADVIRDTSLPFVGVVLYACLCGADGGACFTIAERLRPWANYGMFVIGHRTVGHAYRNPMVRRFPNGGSRMGANPVQAAKWESWRIAMSDPRPSNTLWIRFPWMDAADWRAEFGS